MVAKAVAKVASAYRSNGGDLAAALLPFQCFHHESWWKVRVVTSACCSLHALMGFMVEGAVVCGCVCVHWR